MGDGIEQGVGECLDAEIDGGEEAVCHEDEVSAMGVGNDDFLFGIEEGGVSFDHKRQPAGIGEETSDLFIGGGCSGDGGLADQQAEACIRFERAEELDLVAEDFVVKVPALQVGDGGGLVFFVGAMDDEKSEEVRPGGFENPFAIREIPYLMFVSLFVGCSSQFGWRLCGE